MKKIHPDRLIQKLDARILSDIGEGNIAGASVAVLQSGCSIIRREYGYSDLTDKKPLSHDAIFRLASMTKPVTAVAVLIEAERGRLSLEESVSKYLPKFRNMRVGKTDENGGVVYSHDASREITVSNLLTHTSGLGTDELGARQMNAIPYEQKTNLETITDYYAEQFYLTDSPMERASYSPIAAFDVAARIVELTSDMPFNEYIRQNILEPLGMNDTTFCLSGSQWERMVLMHHKDEKGSYTRDIGHKVFGNQPETYFNAGAGLAGSTDDYRAFAMMLYHCGMGEKARILKPESVAMMSRPWVPLGTPGVSPSFNWGLGCRVITGPDRIETGSFGWSGAFGTHFWVDPHNEIVAVYMKNSMYDGGAGCRTANAFEEDVMGSAEEN